MKAVITIVNDNAKILLTYTVENLPNTIAHYHHCSLDQDGDRIEGLVFGSYRPGEAMSVRHHETRP